jgi:hypothetical protein
MATIAIRHVLKHKRSFAGEGPFLAVLDGSFDGKHVHAVDFEPGDILTTLVVVSQGGGAVGGCAHAVFVV